MVTAFQEYNASRSDVWETPFKATDVRAASFEAARARGWLLALVDDDSRLVPFLTPRYYAEREGHLAALENPYDSLGTRFATVLVDMQDQGYFPKALPRYCVDNPTDWQGVNDRVRRAIHLPFEWEGSSTEAAQWPEPLLLSLIQYFHDQAQRPATVGYVHDFIGCGSHFDHRSAESGAAVYRWRVNELLNRCKIGLQVGGTGEERYADSVVPWTSQLMPEPSPRMTPMKWRSVSVRSGNEERLQRRKDPRSHCSPGPSNRDALQ